MKTNPRRDRILLLKTAQAVVDRLWHRTEGTSLRLRWPSRVSVVNTGGWRAKIGNLGKGQPRLQIWLDRFSGYEAQKFNFSFFWDNRAKMRRLADRAAEQLPVHRRITEKDTIRDGFTFLSQRLRRDEFGPLILEEYVGSRYSIKCRMAKGRCRIDPSAILIRFSEPQCSVAALALPLSPMTATKFLCRDGFGWQILVRSH